MKVEWLEADRAICVRSLLGLLFDMLPKLGKLLRDFLLLAHGEAALFLGVHGSLHVGQERVEQRLRVLNVLVDRLV